ncbi:MAG: class I SAM-dependent methyltransferase [Spirochaetales bacterium]|nr:class I SAM-dependent methyltransferase [Spirochaetales bacterium]
MKTRNDNNALNYGNWVSNKLIAANVIMSLILMLITILFFFIYMVLGIIFLILFGLFFLLSIYFIYARYLFSPAGKNIQAKVYDLVLNYIDFNGQGSVIDIGCGNAPLAIKLAKKFPEAKITGIDNWSGLWDYTKDACEKNAVTEGVGERTTFLKASAARLPFRDESFDVAVSNFVFHEVRDAKDKKQVIKEALRVVKKGGAFVFQDLFLLKTYYGNIDGLITAIESWGVGKVNFINTSKVDFIPIALKLPFMTGKIGIIHGIK